MSSDLRDEPSRLRVSSSTSINPPGGDRLAGARRHLERAAELLPGHAEVAALLGHALLLGGDAGRAVTVLEESLVREPSPRAEFLLGVARLETGDHAAGEAAASRALAENEAFGRAWALRAECRDRGGAAPEAVDDLRRAVDCSPGFEPARLRLAAWLLAGRTGTGPADREPAADAALRVLARRPFEIHGAAALHLAACAQLARGDAARALRTLAGPAFPTAAEAALRRGLARLMLGEFEEAESAFAETEADPAAAEAATRFADHVRGRRRWEGGDNPLPPPRLEALPRICAATLLGRRPAPAAGAPAAAGEAP